MEPQHTNSKFSAHTAPSTHTTLARLNKFELLCRHISRVICLSVFLFSLVALHTIYTINANQQTAQAAQVSELLPDNERTSLKGVKPIGADTSDATQPDFWSDKQLTIFFTVATLSSAYLLFTSDKYHKVPFENKEQQSKDANPEEDVRGEQ